MSDESGMAIDPEHHRFPLCILWTPIPFITWLLPFIGHTGICDSKGVIYDFAGPYHIGVGRLAFGNACKYLQLDETKCRRQEWDVSLHEGNEVYSKRMHNLCLDNCHSHVAKCLNLMAYDGKMDYNMVTIGVWMFFSGRSLGPQAMLKTWGPFLCLLTLLLWAGGAFS